MIKFFRKIRQNLLIENKTGKYLKYAVGEIVLVVIGILIALQINTWKEDRKNTEIEDKYYCLFLEDFKLDKGRIQSIITMNNLARKNGTQLIHNLNNFKLDKKTVLETYLNIARPEGFVASTNAYKDLTSSGNMGILKNNELKQEIIKYYNDMEGISEIIKVNRASISESLINFDKYKSGWVKVVDDDIIDASLKEYFPDDDWHLVKDSEYFVQIQKNTLNAITVYYRSNQLYNEILEKMNSIEEQLEIACAKNAQ